MQRYKVVILDTATSDISKNYQYISETLENEPAAFVHMVEIYRKIKQLEYMPRACKIYEGDSEREYRIMRVKKYLIFYAIDDTEKRVYVTNVFHSHMNPENMMPSDI